MMYLKNEHPPVVSHRGVFTLMKTRLARQVVVISVKFCLAGLAAQQAEFGVALVIKLYPTEVDVRSLLGR